MPSENGAPDFQQIKKDVNEVLDVLSSEDKKYLSPNAKLPPNWNAVVTAFKQDMKLLFDTLETINKYRLNPDEKNKKIIQSEIDYIKTNIDIIRKHGLLSIQLKIIPEKLSTLDNALNQIENATLNPNLQFRSTQSNTNLNKNENASIKPDQTSNATQSNDAAFSRGFMGWTNEFAKLLEKREAAGRSTQTASSMNDTQSNKFVREAFNENSSVQREVLRLLDGLESQKADLVKKKDTLSKENYADKSMSIRNYATQLEIIYKECMANKSTLSKVNPDLGMTAQQQRRNTK